MPAVSKKQQRFMMAELSRKKAGKPGRTDMSITELGHYKKLDKSKKKKSS